MGELREQALVAEWEPPPSKKRRTRREGLLEKRARRLCGPLLLPCRPRLEPPGLGQPRFEVCDTSGQSSEPMGPLSGSARGAAGGEPSLFPAWQPWSRMPPCWQPRCERPVARLHGQPCSPGVSSGERGGCGRRGRVEGRARAAARPRRGSWVCYPPCASSGPPPLRPQRRPRAARGVPSAGRGPLVNLRPRRFVLGRGARQRKQLPGLPAGAAPLRQTPPAASSSPRNRSACPQADPPALLPASESPISLAGTPLPEAQTQAAGLRRRSRTAWDSYGKGNICHNPTCLALPRDR